jgi:phosphoribosyl-AMP cyclohydrolase
MAAAPFGAFGLAAGVNRTGLIPRNRVQGKSDAVFGTILIDTCGYRATKDSMSTESEIRETGTEFLPKFDANGLLTAVVVAAASNAVLMVAHMNAEALAATRATGIAHFWSRSRDKLWQKGETSGHVLTVREIRVDCDQDALVVFADPAGPACHTGATSCFYRRIEGEGLVRIEN